MRKLLFLLIVLLFVPSFSNAYIDLDNNHFAYKDIIELKEKEIALGYPDDTFKPENYITEEELITILLRSANLEVCKDFNNWPYDYIELALNNGIVVDNSLVTTEEFIQFVAKISVLAKINNLDDSFDNKLNKKIYALSEINIGSQNLTRAESCMYINKLIKADEKTTIKELPQETEIYYTNNKELEISTIVKSVEVFEYDTYEGKYVDVINQIKSGEHPYLKGRNKNAKGKYIVAIEFNTINNSKYGTWTSYKSLKFEKLEVKDAFDTDEINSQLSNCAYDATLIKPNQDYTVTAFYILDNKPEELVVNRDITTLYNLQTHEYVDAYSFSKINIKL